jgi:hypothetical protein
MTEVSSLFFAEENRIGDPKHDGWWVMMHEPPEEDGIERGMIIFTRLSEETARRFVERFNAALEWYHKSNPQ